MPALTGLRGIAALWVLLLHLPISRNYSIIANGYLSVDLFFILSGFILSHVYFGRLSGSIDYLAFLRARIARVYPLHLFALAITVAMVATLPGMAGSHQPGTFNWRVLPLHIVMAQTWTTFDHAWNGPSWSLSAEWLAYLTFPLSLWIAAKARSPTAALCLAISFLALLAVLFLIAGTEHMQWAGRSGILRVALEFPAGVLLQRAFAGGIRVPVIGVPFIALSFVPGLTPIAYLGFAFLILEAAEGHSVAAAICASPLAVFLGEISYSLYIMHWNIIQAGDWIFGRLDLANPTLFQTAIVCAVIAIVTYSAHIWVELPARRWGRRLMAHNQAAA